MNKLLALTIIAAFMVGASYQTSGAQDCPTSPAYTGDCLATAGCNGNGADYTAATCYICRAGKYKASADTVAGACSNCAANCTTCASGATKDGNQCFECGNGRYREAAANTTEAPTGTCLSCMGCANNCQTAAAGTNAGLCYLGCATGYGNFTGNTTNPSGSTANGLLVRCGTCPANCTNCNANNNTCATCATGYYAAADRCTACPTNCTACTNATGCTACVNGTVVKNGTCGPAFAGKVYTSIAVVISAALLSLFF